MRRLAASLVPATVVFGCGGPAASTDAYPLLTGIPPNACDFVIAP